MSDNGRLAVARATVHRLEFDPQEVAELKANLMRMALKATVIVRSPERTPEGKVQYVEVPDNPIQLAATVRALEHAAGKPRQSIEVLNPPGQGRGSPGLRELAALMQENPEIMAKVVGALQGGLKLAQPIDVTATSSVSPTQPPESQSGAFPSAK